MFRAARDRTVIAVTHRLSTIQRADKVIVQDQGQAVEKGSPKALTNDKGQFQRHLQLQMGAQRPS